MLSSGKNKKPLQSLLEIVSTALLILGFSTSSISLAQTDTTTPTTINISDTPKVTNAQRLGVNLGTQNFWDSGLMMRNLAFRNPGFEGESWQSILHCKVVTVTSCTDDNSYNYWPANFLNGGTASFIVGPAAGTTAKITTMQAATIGVVGLTLNFSGLSVAPSVGDYVVVRTFFPGNPLAGWWTQQGGGSTFTVETTDLSPNTPGKQALAINASGAGQTAALVNFDDGVANKMFVHLNGAYTVSFRAKGMGGANQINIYLSRTVTGSALNFWNTTVNLTNTWKDYSYTFQVTNDTTTRVGPINLQFNMSGSSILLDDVAFTEAASADNPTVYRNAVFESLKGLRPGTLRYMDGGLNWGSSLDNLLATDFGRVRAGYNTSSSEIDDISMGLHDFLVLCQAVGADPWFTLPTGMTTQEMSNMMDYFGGSTSTVYGAKRAALGQTAPWTSVFGTIHLEFGNEVWNTGNPGANISDAVSYGKRATVIFGVAKASPSYTAKSFDFILNGFEAVVYWSQLVLQNSSNYDTLGTATYNYGNYNDASSSEATFGPMLAEPEYMNNSTVGLTNQQAVAAATAGAKPAKLAVYETNIGTQVGSTTQAQVENAIPSVAAGIAVAANMLMGQRDLGITVQNMFALEGYAISFIPTTSGLTGVATTSPIWGATIDMGGATNLRRPMFLTEQLANSAILPTLLSTSQGGLNPTWNQPYTTNDNFSLAGAHYIQSTAYTDGTTMNIVLFNMSRTSALPVNFGGLNMPIGTATRTVLTAPSINASNENGTENVKVVSSSQSLTASTVLTLPPFSMTVLSLPKPIVPIQVYAVTDTCANATLSANGTTTCTANVTGQGKYNSAVTWSAASGSISSNGAYTAPATYPASGKDTVTATSVGDTTKKATFSIAVAPNTITGVTASCPAATLGQGTSLNCTATVSGTGGFSNAYTWSASGGTITSLGNFTAPTTGTSVTVTATSTQDTTKSAKVTLALTPVLTLGPITTTATGTTATINWTLNLPANSAIAYGTTAAENLSTNWNPSTSQNVSLTLTGLQPNTTYYLHPYSFNATQVANGSATVTTTSNTSTISGVAVSCPSTSLFLGASDACAASVSGTAGYSSAVTWTTSLGTISTAGVLTAPTTLTGTSITVKATSVQDPTKSGTVVIGLGQSAAITAVSLSCGATSLTGGGTTTCTPNVTGTGSFSKSVTFSTSAGSITSAGLLTVPVTGTSVTVTATSTQDSTKSGSAIVTINPKLTMGQVTATTTATTAILSWSLNQPANNGVSYGPSQSVGVTTPYVQAQTANPTITLTGLLPATTYIASAFSFAGSQTVSTPLTFTTASASTVTGVSVNCSASTLVAGSSTGCTAAVAGTGSYSSAVTWSTSAGTITSAGALTAPSTGTSVVVKATSVQDATKSATTTITVTPLISISGVTAACSSTKLTVGGSTTCAATVAGTGSYSSGVSWSTSAGSITAAGVLTAPTTGTSVTVKATSTQDPTKSGSQLIALTAQPTVSSVAIKCPTSSMGYSANMTCGATVAGTGSYSSAVTWTASSGSVNASGVVMAPATGSSLILTATSQEDPTKFATSTIALSQKLEISNFTFFATPTTIVLSWNINKQAHSGLNYNQGPGTPYSTTPYIYKTTENPSFTFADLKPGTTYQGQIFSFTDAGETVIQNVTVTTPLK